MDKAPPTPQDLLNFGRARRARARARTAHITLNITPEHKLELKKWANELFLDSPSELIGYLCTKHQEGLLFITAQQDFFAGMSRTIEKRAEAAAVKAAEQATLQVLSDHGLIDSPYKR